MKELKKTRSFRAFIALVERHLRADLVRLSWTDGEIPSELISDAWRLRWQVAYLWVSRDGGGLWKVALESTESYERHSGEGETLREALFMAKSGFKEHQKKWLATANNGR